MKPKDIIKNLKEAGVRSIWDEKEEKWFFSAVDAVSVFSDSRHPRKYWNGLKKRLIKVNPAIFAVYKRAKLLSADGKLRWTDLVDLKQLFRFILELSSDKAELLKVWLAEAGQERVREINDPERSMDRALENWRRMGRSDKWILQRMMSQETRHRLTEYWGEHGIEESEEYRLLTNIVHEGWSRLTVKEHKELKGLKSQNLRDHMTEAELIFMALAEMSARQIAECRQATGYEENVFSAEKGGHIAGHARKELEEKTGKNVITGENFLPAGKKTSGKK